MTAISVIIVAVVALFVGFALGILVLSLIIVSHRCDYED